ncbi:hypothetical protein B0173_02485 [Mycobacterium avium subsp. paratuberculosis]|nr:hypothetical protein B0173_02485 [Mycobacterium avium subsp. paratuberculosis]
MEPLNLACRRRATRLGEQVVDAVLPADRVEEHLHRGMVKPAGEHLAVISQNLLGGPVSRQRRPQSVANRAGTLTRHQPRADTHPGMVVDAGQRFGAGAIGQRETPHHIHLPQLHRGAAFPTFPLARTPIPQSRIDHARPHQGPIHRRLRRHRTHPTLSQLEHQPPWSPVRPRPAPLQQGGLHHGRHLVRTRHRPMRPIHQPLKARRLIAGQPRVQRLARHAYLLGNQRNRQPIADHRQHGLIPLLGHG